MKRIGILGAGAMGSALYTVLSGYNVSIYDRHPEKVQALGIRDIPENLQDFIHNLDCLILAIKPQSFATLGQDLSHLLIISVMAGVSLKALKDGTESSRVVRTMTNLAISKKVGYTGWIASDSLSEDDQELVKSLLDTMGVHHEVSDEKQLHAITALAGSGPAYFFYLTERLAAEAEALGLSHEESLRLAKQVLMGASHLLEQSSHTPKEWRQRVTSKGGTTEAALETLKRGKFKLLFHSAIQAAIKKSEEL